MLVQLQESRLITGASDIALHRLGADDAETRQQMVLDRLCAEVAEEIYEARRRAGLTQVELAQRIGTAQSAVARVEDAEYDGHSLQTIARIAEALNLHVSIRFLRDESPSRRAADT